jgi:DNA polymerase-3 subunit gamma/tau
MSYTVFALKWRPQSFDEIVGQNHIVTNLKSALANNRLAHAYIFAGPRGIGKTSTARILAKSLNCKDGPTVKPCQICPSCLEISQGRSFDVIEIDGASNRGIDEIRTLRENVKFAPVQGKFKIYIIDEVHMLTLEAFNALLKTLEEPPEFVKFIFATTQPNKVILTILSRCQRLDFRRISVMEIIAQLEKIAAAEKINVTKDVLFAIAKSSDGALRDAESVLDQLASFCGGEVALRDVVSILGLVEQEALFEITDKIIRKDPGAVLDLLNGIIDQGKDISVFLDNFIEHWRNLMIAKVSRADFKLVDLPQDICDRLLKQAESFTLDEIFGGFNILVAAREMSKRIDSLRIPLEIALVKLSYDKKNSSGAKIVTAPENKQIDSPQAPLKKIEPKLSHPAPKENIPEPEPPTVNTVTFDEIKNAWGDIMDSIGKIKMHVATYLGHGELMGIDNNALTIAVANNYYKESLESKENKNMIEKVLAQILHADLKVKFTVSPQQPGHKKDDSILKSALDMFHGRVVKED